MTNSPNTRSVPNALNARNSRSIPKKKAAAIVIKIIRTRIRIPGGQRPARTRQSPDRPPWSMDPIRLFTFYQHYFNSWLRLEHGPSEQLSTAKVANEGERGEAAPPKFSG